MVAVLQDLCLALIFALAGSFDMVEAATLHPRTVNATCNCGVKGADRIYGGADAGIQEYPWMVQLRNRFDGFLCGGSIIAPDWVMTAAHCTDGKPHSDIIIRAGSYFLGVKSTTTQERVIARVIQHPSYVPGLSVLDHDISLVQVTKPFVYTAAVAPVCLPFSFPTFDFANQTAISTGWGHASPSGGPSQKLLELTNTFLATPVCKRAVLSVTNNMLCTYKQGSTCSGDSGGLVNWIDPNSKRVFAAGVVSWRPSTCTGSFLVSGSVKVNNYLDWIKKSTGLTFCNP